MEPWPGDSSPNYKPERGSYEVGHANPRMSSAEFTTDILISIADNIPEDLSLDLAIDLISELFKASLGKFLMYAYFESR